MELCQAEGIGPGDEDRVHRGDVQTRLDDRGAEQQLGLSPNEASHRRLEFALLHLSVCDLDSDLGQEAPKVTVQGRDRLHPVVDEEDLPPALQLPLHGVADGLGVEARDVGSNRLAIGRRRTDDREVPDPGDGHLQGARDGRRREGEDVDLAAELLEGLLLAHAEALLLVDDEQPQVGEDDILREEAVGADEDVHLPCPRPLEDLSDGLTAAKAADGLDHHR